MHLIGQGDHKRQAQAASTFPRVLAQARLEAARVGDLDHQTVGEEPRDDFDFTGVCGVLDCVGDRLGEHELEVVCATGVQRSGTRQALGESPDLARRGQIGR